MLAFIHGCFAADGVVGTGDRRGCMENWRCGTFVRLSFWVFLGLGRAFRHEGWSFYPLGLGFHDLGLPFHDLGW